MPHVQFRDSEKIEEKKEEKWGIYISDHKHLRIILCSCWYIYAAVWHLALSLDLNRGSLLSMSLKHPVLTLTFTADFASYHRAVTQPGHRGRSCTDAEYCFEGIRLRCKIACVICDRTSRLLFLKSYNCVQKRCTSIGLHAHVHRVQQRHVCLFLLSRALLLIFFCTTSCWLSHRARLSQLAFTHLLRFLTVSSLWHAEPGHMSNGPHMLTFNFFQNNTVPGPCFLHCLGRPQCLLIYCAFACSLYVHYQPPFFKF